MKWVLFMVGVAGLLAGSGCASQQPYAYYNTPPTMAPPASYPAVAAPQQYAAVAAPPQYYAQPAAPVVQTAPAMAQPVMYAALNRLMRLLQQVRASTTGLCSVRPLPISPTLFG